MSGGGFRTAVGPAGSPQPVHQRWTLYAKAPERTPPPKPVFVYRSEGEAPPTPGRAPRLRVVLSFGGRRSLGSCGTPPPVRWHRFHGADRHVDSAGVPIAPRNVVVMEIPYEFNGSTGNSQPHGVVVGEGTRWCSPLAR